MKHRSPPLLKESLGAPARVGRPARIDSTAVIRAALDIGLDRVTLKQVADRLGVAPSSLYRHVRNRDELVRLAASRHMSMRRVPHVSSNHWVDVALDYAESLFESLLEEPQLINELMRGQLGPEVEADFLEDFLARICSHGFTPGEGLHLYRALAMLTLGGVIGTLACRAGPLPQEVAVRRVLAERPDNELPLLRQTRDEYSRLGVEDWRRAVAGLLAGIALSRGEAVPKRRVAGTASAAPPPPRPAERSSKYEDVPLPRTTIRRRKPL